MDFKRLDERALKRVSGPSWDRIRPQFDRIVSDLLSVSPLVKGELTTIYIKFSTTDSTATTRPFAVLWVKKSTELVLGFALPLDFESPALLTDLSGHKYAGINKYLKVKCEDPVPIEVSKWAEIAWRNANTIP